jgi:glycosyltransferase involved in cell wall biosynthesis
MHVVFLSGSGELGGAERVLLDIMASLRLAQPSWTLSLIAPSDGALVAASTAVGAAAEVLSPGIAVSRLGESTGRPGDGLTPLAARLARAAVPLAQYGRQLRARLRALSPDVIHTHGMKVHLLAAWANPGPASVIWHLHDYVGRRGASAKLLARSLSRCAAIVTNSRSVAADVRQTLGERVPVVPVLNGVDLERFSPEGPCADLDRASRGSSTVAPQVKVGLVATFARWKGHTTFLDAFARLPRDLAVHAYVIGGAMYQTDDSQISLEALQSHARQAGVSDRVTFTGFVVDADRAMRALDVVVHASTEPEPFGLVIAEAMACGRAVIAANAGGAAELVTPGVDALVHRPGDAASLANAIESLASDAALRQRMGVAARQTAVRRFDRRRLAGELLPVYQRVAAGAASA